MRSRVIILILSYSLVALSQECPSPDIPLSTPTSHFVDHGDGTVTDVTTGLMWKRCVESMVWNGNGCSGHEAHFTWGGALERVAAINGGSGYAGHTDWRLPSINDLGAIVERQCSEPSINVEIFPDASTSYFWTSSQVVGSSVGAWYISFASGHYGWHYRFEDHAIRLVRGVK
ncbi:conserved exported hypothetical protein [Gammaproteobacteria bacterium]